MTESAILQYETHQHIRVVTSRGEQYGDNTHITPVTANELHNLALEYPVFFTKNEETGQFELTALLGFEQHENLFLQGDHWDASYIPMHILRQPFAVTHQERKSETDEQRTLISLDMNSRRLQKSHGEALFNQDGSQTPYLRNMTDLLAQLISSTKSTNAFISTIVGLNLLEATSLQVTFQGKETVFEGLYAINEKKLNSLSAEPLHEMYKKGYLQASYLHITSMGNIKKLVARKNTRLNIM